MVDEELSSTVDKLEELRVSRILNILHPMFLIANIRKMLCEIFVS